jgi:hypothetical protein
MSSSFPAPVSRRDYSRWKAWLPWIAGAILVAGVVAFLISYDVFGIRNTAHVDNPVVGSKAATPPAPKRVTVPANKEALQTIIRFLDAAVARKDLPTSYALVTPGLRQGMTLKQWNTGEIPIPFFPIWEKGAGYSHYSVQWSYKNELMIQVLLGAKKSAKLDPLTLWVGAKRIGGKWLVWYVAPRWFAPVPTDSQ